MAQGRGGATQATMAIGLVMLTLLLLNGELAESEKFAVGDVHGWAFDVNNWPTGKTFHADDILEFKYQKDYHNVVKVDSNGYANCKTDNAISTFDSGDDQIKLASGTHYFICGIADHWHGESIRSSSSSGNVTEGCRFNSEILELHGGLQGDRFLNYWLHVVEEIMEFKDAPTNYWAALVDRTNIYRT
ncbi:Chemocyanin [Dendrobium catenatum]|uniref:Chemocyanin n=1 Tax=Dendrobium catenatum TaxID=906689 RepID=A0A2I0WAR3_9ASPA|nr:Chemocyanin [Dendrobium catenatum]